MKKLLEDDPEEVAEKIAEYVEGTYKGWSDCGEGLVGIMDSGSFRWSFLFLPSAFADTTKKGKKTGAFLRIVRAGEGLWIGLREHVCVEKKI